MTNSHITFSSVLPQYVQRLLFNCLQQNILKLKLLCPKTEHIVLKKTHMFICHVIQPLMKDECKRQV